MNALSHQAFFNSLFAETDNKKQQGDSAFLPLSETMSLQLQLSYISPAWRHRYTGSIILHHGAIQEEIQFEQALALILDNLYPSISEQKRKLFSNRVLDSNKYIESAEQSLMDREENQENAFIQFEQNLTAGHSMHPAAKSCEPLNQQQQQQYLPEHAAQFSIEWFAVHQSHLVGDSVAGTLQSNLNAFYDNAIKEGAQDTDNYLLDPEWIPLPMHPLQAKAWRESEDALTLNEVVKDLHTHSSGWTATSSSRALYHPHQPWMLKVSLPVKLTNSLRLLTSSETKRGVQFSKLLQTPAGEEMQQRLPNSYFIEEPLWCSIINNQGTTLDLPIISFRENPFYQKTDSQPLLKKEQYYCLASANQVTSQQTRIVTWINNYAQDQHLCFEHAASYWFSEFLDNVIAPICIARSDYGIVLLAHQQNILLNVVNNLPVGVAYRDCQGIGLTDQALATFSAVLENEPAHYFMPADELNPYHAYYVIANSLLSTIANIASTGLVSEKTLWSLSQDKISELAASHPRDGSFYQYLLQSPTLSWKRNFYCFLADHNEATLADPSQIYCQINNPLQQLNTDQLIFKKIATGRTLCFANQQDNNSESFISFSIRERGQKLAQATIEKRGTHCYLAFSEGGNEHYKTDPHLWWSAAEHGFYQLNVKQLRSNYYPPTIESLVQENADNNLLLTQFLNVAPLWREPQPYLVDVQRHISETGIEYPTRPARPEGIVYSRYFYHLKRQITFRVIDSIRDLSCFNKWHNHPIISPVWELEGSKNSHKAYLEKMEKDPHQYAVIGEFDGIPFGYFEVYWTPEDRLGPYYEYQEHDRGVHILVGNFNFRNGIYFDAWGSAILHYCFLDDLRTESIMGEPRADNHRVVKITERIGLQKLFEFDFPHKRAALLKCDRERFFNQFVI